MSGYKAREGQGDKTVIDDIVKNTKKAAAILSDIRALPADRLDKEMVLGLLRRAVCIKLMIPEVDEPQIKNLVITGIKQQVMRAGGLSDNVIRQQIKNMTATRPVWLHRRKPFCSCSWKGNWV